MGRIWTTKAKNSLDGIMLLMGCPPTSNTWKHKGETYFYELGREQADGSITGTVHLCLPDNKARQVGSFKCCADGAIPRFHGTPAAARRNAAGLSHDKVQRMWADWRAKEYEGVA